MIPERGCKNNPNMVEAYYEIFGFDKQEAANLKIRAQLLLEIRKYSRKKGLKQKDAATLPGTS